MNPSASKDQPSNCRARQLFCYGLQLLAASGLLAGCAVTTPRDLVLGDGCQLENVIVKAYQPENVFLQAAVLPRNVRRVAVMPLACEDQRRDLADACDMFNPILPAELVKTRKFEVVSVSADTLRNRTGRSGWAGNEVLPTKFFDSLMEIYGCDAVFFCQLTAFSAHPPLVIGWRMKLVDARTRQILWAGDEVINAGQPEVLAGARRYLLDEQRTSMRTPDEWTIRNSPRQFAEYSSACLLATLPSR